MSFPVLLPISNGTSGLGEFGTTDPTFSFEQFHFSGYLQDSTSVVGLQPACTQNECFSYFLPGGLNSVNTSCQHLMEGVAGAENLCAQLAANGLSGGDLGTLGIMTGFLGGSQSNQNQNLNPFSILNGGMNFSQVLGPQSLGNDFLNGIQKRQALNTTDEIGNMTVPLQEIGSNGVNWAEFRANQTRDFGNKDFAYITYDAIGYRLDFEPVNTWPQIQ